MERTPAAVAARKIWNGRIWKFSALDGSALLYSGAVCAAACSGAALSWRSADGLSVFSDLFKKCAETLSGKLYILSLCK